MAEIPLNPLSAAFRGFQSAQQKAQQQQQAMEAAALNEQLKQLQIAEAQQSALQAPLRQALLAEQFRKALMSPEQIAIENAKAANISQLANQPGVIFQQGGPIEEVTPEAQQILGMRQTAEEFGGVPFNREGISGIQMQTAIPGLPGAVISPAAKRAEESLLSSKLAQEVLRTSQLAKAKADAVPPGYQVTFDSTGNAFYVPKTPGRGEVQAVTTPEGEQLKGKVSGAGVRGGLTANAENNLYAKAGTAKISDEKIQSDYMKEGVLDWRKLSIDANRIISEDKKLAAEEKAKQIPAGDRSKAAGFIGAYEDLNKLTDMALKLKAEGKEAGAWDRAVSTALQQPPDSVFSALFQTAIGQSLTADTRQLDSLKSRVRGAVTRANAGLSQTQSEIANLTQYVPIANDSLEQTLEKASGLQEFLKSQVSSLIVDPQEWLSSLDKGATVPVPRGTSTATPTTTPIQIKSIRRKQ